MFKEAAAVLLESQRLEMLKCTTGGFFGLCSSSDILLNRTNTLVFS